MKDLSKEEELEYKKRINKAFTNNEDKMSGEDYGVSGMDMYRFLVEANVIKEEPHPYLDLFDKLFPKNK